MNHIVMHPGIARTAKVDGHKAPNDGLYFTDTIRSRKRPVIDQFSLPQTRFGSTSPVEGLNHR